MEQWVETLQKQEIHRVIEEEKAESYDLPGDHQGMPRGDVPCEM